LRAVVQRVSSARVLVDGDTVGEIGVGLCILLGVADDDDLDTAGALAGKVVRLRIFANQEGKFDRSLADVHGSALVVSQFTLIADSKRQRGTRPSFTRAAKPDQAEPLYEAFIGALADDGIEVQSGIFGARMQLELVNDGPVTIIIET
jgi:D-tyrosyl-tRNA(Tyr) deacylase